MNKFILTGSGEKSKKTIMKGQLSMYYQQLSEAKAKIKKN